MAHWYLSEKTQRKLFNEYQHDRVQMVFKNLCFLVLRTKVASALEGLKNAVLVTSFLSNIHYEVSFCVEDRVAPNVEKSNSLRTNYSLFLTTAYDPRLPDY